MRLKIGENLPDELCDDLRNVGHDADSVIGAGLAGSSFVSLLAVVQRKGQVFLTLDKGIANMRNFPPEAYSGIVLFRPSTSGRAAVRVFVRRHLPDLRQIGLNGRLAVVTERGIRLR